MTKRRERASKAEAVPNWFAQIPSWVRTSTAFLITLAIGVQTHKGVGIASAAANAISGVTVRRWDCINAQGFPLRELLAIIACADVPIGWCFQALSATIIPAMGVGVSAVTIAVLSSHDTAADATKEMNRWLRILTPFSIIIGVYIVLFILASVTATAHHFTCFLSQPHR